MHRIDATGLSRRALLGTASAFAASLSGVLPMEGSEPRITTPPYNTLSFEEEIALGRKFAQEYEKDVELIRNPLIGPYLDDIVRRLGKNSQRPDWPYRIQTVNSAVINASAIPGGFLYVQRGMLEFVDDENELVGALAHEMGHVVARHTTNQLMLTFLARNLYETVKKNILLNNSVISGIIEQLGGPVVLLAQLKYSRENESEADLLGFYEMLRAGWNPIGLMNFFERIRGREGNRSPLDVMLSDHPSSAGRIDEIKKEIDSVKVTAPVRMDTLKFRALKSALRLMPPAPKPAHQE
ncbi:MAG TPA: M48 family metalloprotease [Bryobacteraceae bacterium]|jgi:predicted Zn-dependent protease|nr:M48 family metalloprotease [Bryobacteraceae bacterium]